MRFGNQARIVLLDPAWLGLNGGDWAEHTLQEDVYFEPEPFDPALGIALDKLVSTLSEEEQECVRMHVFERLSYQAIAVEHEWYCGKPPYPDRKRAWRVTQVALRKLREKIEDREWIKSLATNAALTED